MMSVPEGNDCLATYWWRGKASAAVGAPLINFGDALTPILVEHFLGRTACWVPTIAKAELLVVGSIIEAVPAGWTGTILGCGRKHENGQAHLDDARVLALRGPLTADGRDCTIGDPGLLVPDLVGPQPERWNLGVIPHWTDGKLAKRHPGAHIINVQGDPLTVAREIGSCRSIVTSSLHGLIVADAFGIPATAMPSIRTQFPEQFPREGGSFKWQDYAASLGVEHHWGWERIAPQRRLHELQDGLRRTFGCALS